LKNRYFLEEKAAGGFSLFGGGGSPAPAPATKVSTGPSAADKAKEVAEARRQAAEEKRKAVMQASLEKKKKADEARLAAVENKKQLAEATRKAAADKKASASKPAPAQRSPTFPLFNREPAAAKPPKAAKPAPKRAPPGVPSLVDWKRNFDGSISGYISGSKAFPEGEFITTSMIANGTAKAGQVVQTGSGSKYFLV
jgi:membrane protein involved in colicin uptake